MKTSCIVAFAVVAASLAGCAAESGPEEPSSVAQSEEALTAKKSCPKKKTETSCLASSAGCVWGDKGNGSECFYIGKVVPLPAPSPAPPAACTSNFSETSCLAESGCVWGDEGNGHVCFYIGQVFPQAR